jgi:SOS-response transcriptional repressor LexA
MEPRIPDGSWCLFRPVPVGSREGRILLVQLQTENGEGIGRFTLKRYHSEKSRVAEDWEHAVIELQPLNSAFSSIRLTAENVDGVVINAEFVAVVAA